MVLLLQVIYHCYFFYFSPKFEAKEDFGHLCGMSCSTLLCVRGTDTSHISVQEILDRKMRMLHLTNECPTF